MAVACSILFSEYFCSCSSSIADYVYEMEIWIERKTEEQRTHDICRGICP